jgi:hypothetical protein
MLSRLLYPLVGSLALTLVTSPLTAQDRPYTEGSVWAISMIRATDGMQNDYLQSLATTWKRNQEEAKKQGLILSYHVLRTNASGPNDWDLLLMVEYKNWAALDGVTAKFDIINRATLGGADQERQLMTKRLEVRRIVGTKNAQELILK